MSQEIKLAIKNARESFNQNDYISVVKKCRSILKKDNNNYVAHILMAAAMMEIEEYRSQIPLVLQRAFKIEPNNPLSLRGLITYYEKHANTDDCCCELVETYCHLLQINSEADDFPKMLRRVSELCTQLKDIKVLVESIDSLIELQKKLDNAKAKMLKETLVHMLTSNTSNSANLKQYNDLLESILISLINEADMTNQEDYYRKYLKVLYDKGKLTSVVTEGINMQQCFPRDIFVLEYICRAYYEYSILEEKSIDIDITEVYESLLKHNTMSKHATIAKAAHLEKTGNLIVAREVLKEMVTLQPCSLYAWILLSKINVRLYCWEEAEYAARQALKLRQCKVNDELTYKMEIILLQAMSRCNNTHKLEVAFEMCEKMIERHDTAQLKLIHARICLLLHNSDLHTKINDLESQDETRVAAKILRALYLKRQNRLEDAVNALDSALETSEAWLLLGTLYWEMSEKNDSLLAFLSGIKADRYNWECLVYLGHYYRQYANNMERSRRCYQTALQINPNSEEAGIGLSTVYRVLKNHCANIQLLQWLTAQDSGPKWAWLQLGLEYLDQGDATKAIKAFQRVIRVDPKDNRSWESLADAYFLRSAYTSALKSYQRALEIRPESLYPMIKLANIKLIIGQYTEAREDFQRILLNEANYIPALKGLAEACLSLAKEKISQQLHSRANENLQQAIDSLTIAVMQRKDISCIWKLLGDTCYTTAIMAERYSYLKVKSILMKSNDIESTILMKRRDIFFLCTRCYCSALSISPKSAVLWHDLASCYLMQLHLDPLVEHKTVASKCLAAAKYAVKLSPSSWIHWNLLGVICMSPYIKNYALAQHAFITAIDIESNSATAWSNLATLYLYIGNFIKANAAYYQSQRLDPAYVNCWLGQALTAEILSTDEAMDLFRHSIQLGYHDQAALGYSHCVLTTLLDPKSKQNSLQICDTSNINAVSVATDVLNWYIQFHPTDCYARNTYGLLLERQKRYRSAAEQFAAALSITTKEMKDFVRINLARVLILLKKYNESVELCQAVKGATFNSQCHLALSLFKASQYEQSYSSFERALHLFTKTEMEKACILCAMAAIAYIFERINDAKTLLFQSMQIQPPVVTGFLAAASLGMLHGDFNLTTLVLKELKLYTDHAEYGYDVVTLTAIFYLIESKVKDATSTFSKAIFRHPSDARYWIGLLQILSEADLHIFIRCAQKAMFLSRHAASTNIVRVACASSFSYFSKNVALSDTRSLQKLVFTYPGNIESWATFIAAILPRSLGKESIFNVQWILNITSMMQKLDQSTNSMTKWLCDNKTKLT